MSGGGGEKGSATTKTPADFLKSIRGRPVVVKLNSGVDYRGILACLDGYMNIAMEQTEEYVNGQLKNNSVHQHFKADSSRWGLALIVPCNVAVRS
ncbi:hypothetical protein EUGRSUZ_L00039 [Eucalyptus grandis]|uniref:Sm domain-containing protein n=2 Tax=Eucalyptus grandis TaxID=71139 RepID=A0A058ZW95_EUCGR|nr:hypothetical protein EUGRSUZ_L00039 [Eucalyptus grandis]